MSLDELRERAAGHRLLKGALITAALTGAGVVAWKLWKRLRLPVRERVEEVPRIDGAPDAITEWDHVHGNPLQLTADGAGPLYHRRYQIHITGSELTARELMARIQRDPDHFSPHDLARFEKTVGSDDGMQPGDEFYIHILGPWDGPVRVVRVKPQSFTLVTLDEHLEAGEIRFECEDLPGEGNLRFTIRSWARSRDDLVRIGYALGVVKEAQTSMWVMFCNNVVQASGGELAGDIDVLTQKAPFEGEVIRTEPGSLHEQFRDQLEAFEARAANFDLEQRHEATEEAGWNVDRYQADLPAEPPGEPVAGGPWDIARDVIRSYEFPDPDLITGIFLPDAPLEGRVIVLRARFLIFTFLFGVRVGRVIDETRSEGGEQARVWGFSYHTLEGHFEMGEASFTVWKFVESGRVQFRIQTFSRIAHIPNIFYRIGFRMFGRGLQRRFARTAMQRMQDFVAERLEARETGRPEPQPQETTEVLPASADEAAEEEMEETMREDAARG